MDVRGTLMTVGSLDELAQIPAVFEIFELEDDIGEAEFGDCSHVNGYNNK